MNCNSRNRQKSLAPFLSNPVAWAGVLIASLGLFKLLLEVIAPFRSEALDPIFEVPLSNVARIAGVLEIGFGLSVVWLRKRTMAARAVWAIGVLFLFFRYLYSTYGEGLDGCACLGNIEGLFPALHAYQNKILLSCAVFCVLCGLNVHNEHESEVTSVVPT